MWKPILSITPIAVAAALLLFATWVGRFLIVVPTYYQPHLPYRIVPYTPTTFEWAVTLLTYGFLAFFYLVLIKIIPVLEFPEGPAPEVSQDSILRLPLQEMPENLKRLLLSLTIVLGMTLVVLGLYWGITGPDRPMGGASATWVFGGIILVGALPFLTCLIRPKLKASES